jgi:hypothetical protein
MEKKRHCKKNMLHNGNDPCASAIKFILWTAIHSIYEKPKRKVLFGHIYNLLLSLVRISQFGTHQASDLFLMLSHDCVHLGWMTTGIHT